LQTLPAYGAVVCNSSECFGIGVATRDGDRYVWRVQSESAGGSRVSKSLQPTSMLLILLLGFIVLVKFSIDKGTAQP
jgi:hypothetical protein